MTKPGKGCKVVTSCPLRNVLFLTTYIPQIIIQVKFRFVSEETNTIILGSVVGNLQKIPLFTD